MSIYSVENYKNNLEAMPVSGKMAKYVTAVETPAGNTSPAAPGLSEEEIAQQLDTVDNGVKSAALPKSGTGSTIVGTTRGSEEAESMAFSLHPEADKFKFNWDGSLTDGGLIFSWFLESGTNIWGGVNIVEGKESTPDNPVIYVAITNYPSYNNFSSAAELEAAQANIEFTWHKINVNAVNPNNATAEEMFAFIAHTYMKDGEDPVNALTTFSQYVGCGLAEKDGPDLLTGFTANIKQLAKFQSGLGASGQQFFDELMKMLDKMGSHTAKTHADVNKAINAQRAPYKNLTTEPRV